MKICLAATMFFLLLSCKKDEIDHSHFFSCHQSMNLDSSATSNKLIGSWKWEKQFCFSSAKTKKADKTVIVSFNSDGTFTLTENAIIISQGNWKIKIVDLNMWGLDIINLSSYLEGRILFCDNQVLFNASYIDKCDNLFIRQ